MIVGCWVLAFGSQISLPTAMGGSRWMSWESRARAAPMLVAGAHPR